MQIRADLGERVVVRPQQWEWVASPMAGVERMMLDREGGEVARATSLVRYVSGSRFEPHVHGGGEEFLVLEGTFEDELGRYEAGAYVRNPPGSRHAPASPEGCLLFVKLRQFAEGDGTRVVRDTRRGEWLPGLVPGLTVQPLHAFGHEHVALVKWAPGTWFRPHSHFGGEEILVLDGTFEDEFGAYPAGTWLRNPHMSRHHPFSREGCLIYVKVGHLAPDDPAQAGTDRTSPG